MIQTATCSMKPNADEASQFVCKLSESVLTPIYAWYIYIFLAFQSGTKMNPDPVWIYAYLMHMPRTI